MPCTEHDHHRHHELPDAAFGGVLLPVYVNEVFGNPLNIGLFIGVMGGGAVVGSLIYGAIGHRLPRYATFVGMFILTSLYTWAFALFLPFPMILVGAAIAGVGSGPLNPIIDTVIFERAIRYARASRNHPGSAWMTMPLNAAGGCRQSCSTATLLLAVALPTWHDAEHAAQPSCGS
jgi:MFS family permease